jgi:hypothetical protein
MAPTESRVAAEARSGSVGDRGLKGSWGGFPLVGLVLAVGILSVLLNRQALGRKFLPGSNHPAETGPDRPAAPRNCARGETYNEIPEMLGLGNQPNSAKDAAAGPFSTLVAAWSIVVVVIAVAGFSVRWNYFYNFGLQSLAVQTSVTALPLYATEILRRPEALLITLKLAAKYWLTFEILVAATRFLAKRSLSVTRIAAAIGPSPIGLAASVDALRLGLLIFVAFLAGAAAGDEDFRASIVESSVLPKITAIDTATGEHRLPFLCGAADVPKPPSSTAFVGDADLARLLTAAGSFCDSDKRSWRLLYRDKDFTYVFATVSKPLARRPETLILRNSDKLVVILK